MARYIDAEKLEEKFRKLYDSAFYNGAPPEVIADRMDYLEDIYSAPTEDVAPVKHAYWIIEESGSACRCSNCQKYWIIVGDLKYCPNCGAKMNGKEKE